MVWDMERACLRPRFSGRPRKWCMEIDGERNTISRDLLRMLDPSIGLGNLEYLKSSRVLSHEQKPTYEFPLHVV